MDDAISHREATAPHLPNIDFVTEFPKPRNMKKGRPLGECEAVVLVLLVFINVVILFITSGCIGASSCCGGLPMLP